MENKNHIDDVFGVNRTVPMTYVEREAVDQKFIDSLSRKKHIVVYGGSKQGKTSLRKHSLTEDQYVVVQCSGTATVKDVYAGILKEAGATIEVLETSTLSGNKKIGVSFGGSILGALGVDGGVESETSSADQVQSVHFEIDPADPNDVIRVLTNMEFNKFVVIEDYHYLQVSVQKQLALDLKAFHEKSDISFIVVGVWLHQNRLVLYNGDLTNRVIPVDADVWDGDELYQVMKIGEALLNVSFQKETVTAIISASQGNVGLLQELCHSLCEAHGIRTTQENQRAIGSPSEVAGMVDRIAAEQAGRYRNFIVDFAAGFQASKHELYKWILAVVICSKIDQLKDGLKQSDIYNRIRINHPHKENLQYANLVQSLRSISRLQQTKGIQPVILDFNESENRLRIVDSGFLLFVDRQDTEELLSNIDMQLDSNIDH